MIDDGLVHRTQDAIGDVGRSWNLKKVAARMKHQVQPIKFQIEDFRLKIWIADSIRNSIFNLQS